MTTHSPRIILQSRIAAKAVRGLEGGCCPKCGSCSKCSCAILGIGKKPKRRWLLRNVPPEGVQISVDSESKSNWDKYMIPTVVGVVVAIGSSLALDVIRR